MSDTVQATTKPCPKCGKPSRLAAITGDCLECVMSAPAMLKDVSEAWAWKLDGESNLAYWDGRTFTANSEKYLRTWCPTTIGPGEAVHVRVTVEEIE